MTAFLRNLLLPCLKRFGVGACLIHHGNKPTSEQAAWKDREQSYAGSGHAEFGNAARATLTLESTSGRSLFQLRVGKGMGKINWRDESGNPVSQKPVRHTREGGGICWFPASSSEVIEADRISARNDEATVKGKILSLFPNGGELKQDEILSRIKLQKIPKATALSILGVLVSDNLIERIAKKSGRRTDVFFKRSGLSIVIAGDISSRIR